MTNSLLVSIIIPTYNRASLIGETLDSILAQTYRNWECILVDDGSTDNTEEILKEYIKRDNRFQYHKRPDSHKSGGNGARNYGFEISKGEYINWFDSDDLMHPEKLEKQIIKLSKSDYNFSVCQTLVFEENIENILGLRHERIFSETVLHDFIKLNIVFLTQSPIFKKSFLEAHNLKFDEELKAAQEWEFISRILFFSPQYLEDNTPLVYQRQHKNSITYNPDNSKREWNYYLAREKIFHFLKDKQFSNKKDTIDYLQDYAVRYLKKNLYERNFKNCKRIYWSVLNYNRSHFFNMRIIIGMFVNYAFKRIKI